MNAFRSMALTVGVALTSSCAKRSSEPGPPEQTKPAPTQPHTAPSPAPAEPPPPAATLAGDLAVGTAQPALFVTAADDGSWTVICQARKDTNGDKRIAVSLGQHGAPEGDTMLPYLIRGGGDGEPFTTYVGASRDDQWIVIVRDGGLHVIETKSGRDQALTGADVRLDRQLTRPRLASFTTDNRFVVYFRGDHLVVIRELGTGTEREIKIDGNVWRAEAVTGSPWMRLLVLRDDTDKNGRLDWPAVETSRPTGETCLGPAMSYSTYGQTGDTPATVWLRPDTGKLVDDKDVIAPLSDGILRRSKDGAITFDTRVVIPASCHAAVLGTIPSPLRVAAACEGTGEVPLELFGEDFHAVLDKKVPYKAGVTSQSIQDAPLLCVNEDECYSPLDGKRTTLPGQLITLHEHRALVRGSAGYAVVDLDDPKLTATPLPAVTGDPTAQAAYMFLVGDTVVDLRRAVIMGTAPKHTLAITTTGRALVTLSDPELGVLEGVVRWTQLKPPT